VVESPVLVLIGDPAGEISCGQGCSIATLSRAPRPGVTFGPDIRALPLSGLPVPTHVARHQPEPGGGSGDPEDNQPETR
jgi:hypothetical protein